MDSLARQMTPLKKKFLVLDEGEQFEFTVEAMREVLTNKLNGLQGNLSGFITGANVQDRATVDEVRKEVPAAVDETNALIARLGAFYKRLADEGLYPAIAKPVK